MATGTSTAGAQVQIERYIEQVQDGRQYKGYLKIGGEQFDHDFVLGIPLSKLEEMSEEELLKRVGGEFRKLFSLAVKRGDAVIELTDEEHGLFCSILMYLVEKFYNNNQTRACNESPVVGAALRGRGLLGSKSATVSICMTDTVVYTFSPEICEMLRAPKFGCTF